MKNKSKIIVIAAALFAFGLYLGVGTAAATTILPGPEVPLTGAGGILDQLYGLANLQRVDDGIDQVWSPANGRATAQAKFASYDQEFGYLPDLNDPGFADDSFVSLFTVTANGINLGGPTATLGSGNVNFLWAVDPSGAPLWTSSQSQNSDGLDHMVTWEIIDKPNAFVIAWEDLVGGGDQDYNDLVVEVNVAPVPVPGTFLLLGLGLAGLAVARKRFKR